MSVNRLGLVVLTYVSASKLRPIGVNNGRVKLYYQSSIGLAAVGEHAEWGLSVHCSYSGDYCD